MGLPSEVNWLVIFPKQSWSSSEMICWSISQPNSPEYHPVKFLSQPCPFLQKNHVMHAHLTSRLPSAYEMHCDVISITHITHANISPCIYSHNLNHTIMLCNFSFHHIKISSRGLMIKQEQFYLNHSIKHINSQKLFCEHCFRNSKTLGHCSYQNTDYRFTL